VWVVPRTFWLSYGILNVAFLTGKLAAPQGRSPELSVWFVALAAITWMGAVAATRTEDLALTTTLVLLAAGATIQAIAKGLDVHGLWLLGGWVFVVGAVCAWYTATAMMFEHMFGRVMLPARHGQTAVTHAQAVTSAGFRPAPPSQRSA
jgi:succinate-acetate transporter protein